jgi:hypothetical protein
VLVERIRKNKKYYWWANACVRLHTRVHKVTTTREVEAFSVQAMKTYGEEKIA